MYIHSNLFKVRERKEKGYKTQLTNTLCCTKGSVLCILSRFVQLKTILFNLLCVSDLCCTVLGFVMKIPEMLALV